MSKLTRWLATTPFATPVAFGVRTRTALGHVFQEIRRTVRWLRTSREHTNYTYELSSLNVEHLAWWVANLVDIEVSVAREYIREAQEDLQLREHIVAAVKQSKRWRLADPEVRLHKRLGWYALVRATKPANVIETGTDKGLGTVVLAAAVLRNGGGRVTTIDINPDSGYVIADPYDSVIERRVGDSASVLGSMTTAVDFFVHDSLHTEEHELIEFRAVQPRLSARALVLSDYAHASGALPQWAEETGRSFHFFAEEPQEHWFRGEGIGVAAPRNGRRSEAGDSLSTAD